VQPNGDAVARLWWYNRPPNTILPNSQDKLVGNPFIKTEYRSINKSGTSVLASIKDYSYDNNNNLLSVDEYDCLSNACGSIAVPTSPPTQTAAQQVLTSPTRHSEFTYYTSTSPSADGVSSGDPIWEQADAYWNWFGTTPSLLNARKSAKITGTGAPKYSEYLYDNARSTGNLTDEFDYDSTKAGSLSCSPSSGSTPPSCLTAGNAVHLDVHG
jgi:hypothetical protein